MLFCSIKKNVQEYDANLPAGGQVKPNRNSKFWLKNFFNNLYNRRQGFQPLLAVV
jgi:hypothetical protein